MTNDEPHFMGVPGGSTIWDEIEARHAHLLSADAEVRRLDHLAERFDALGIARVED